MTKKFEFTEEQLTKKAEAIYAYTTLKMMLAPLLLTKATEDEKSEYLDKVKKDVIDIMLKD